jgi:predicted nucleic-acid-binding protein
MIAVDTNVLVRALVDDPKEPRQSAVARARLTQAKQVYVPLIVQVEMVWVLGAAHELSKAEILSVLDHLHQNTAFHLQDRAQFEIALTEYRRGSADFADYLILAESRSMAAKLLTFDKRLQKSEGVEAP